MVVFKLSCFIYHKSRKNEQEADEAIVPVDVALAVVCVGVDSAQTPERHSPIDDADVKHGV